MRTNLDINDDLMEQAMHASGLPTKKATVEEALRLLVLRRAQRQALDELWGAGWEGNLDEMREGRHFNDIK
jgi:Arc/MetJ family transcription regulator